MPVHRRLTTRQFTVLIVDEATVSTATAAALAAQWSNSSPLQLSAALGINVTSASAPVVTTQTRIENVTVSTMMVVDCPPGFWGANGECVACAKGTYRSGSGRGNATGCLECPAGTYQPSDGGSECIVCGNKLARPNPGLLGAPLLFEAYTFGAGNYSANTLSCEPCQVGEYWLPARLRRALTADSTTQGRGSKSEDQCVCQVGYFWPMTPARCPTGLTAPALG